MKNEAHLLVTGSSGSIGAALATALRLRYPASKVTLMDLREPESESLASRLGGQVQVIGTDLSRSAEAQAALERARESFGPIFGLINCAGFMEVSRFDRLAWTRAESLLMVDLVSPLRLMHSCVPAMIAAREGFVVNIASMAGKVTLPGGAFYCAAKAGLSMASEVARYELAPLGVRVVTVYPGAVRSPLEQRARDQYGQTAIARWVPTGSPEVLAKKVVNALDENRARVVYPAAYALGLLNLAGPFALRVGPKPVG